MSDEEDLEKHEQARKEFMAIDRREEQREFLKRWGKKIPPHLAGPQPREIRPPSQPPMFSQLWKGTKQNRVLVCRSSFSSDYNVMVVDDDGTCGDGPAYVDSETWICPTQNHVSHDFHTYHTFGPYAGAQPVLCAVRCPESLTKDEWLRVMDRDNVKRWVRDNPKGKKEPSDTYEPGKADW